MLVDPWLVLPWVIEMWDCLFDPVLPHRTRLIPIAPPTNHTTISTQGWIAFYIDSVIGPENEVDPYIKLLAPGGKRIRWYVRACVRTQSCFTPAQ